MHELRGRGLDVVCLNARHASAALKIQLNKGCDQAAIASTCGAQSRPPCVR